MARQIETPAKKENSIYMACLRGRPGQGTEYSDPMNAASRDRLQVNHGLGGEQADLPLLLSVLTYHRDLIDHVHRLTGALTAGDFEALVIWCELARQCGDGVGGAMCPVPLHDLVTATAIPRETVRRKLERLAALGHVTRIDRGWVLHAAQLVGPQRHPIDDAARRVRDALASDASAKPGGTGQTAS